MAGQRIGYIRVSGLDQNTQRQLEGVALDRIFTDKASGKDTRRPQLDELLRFIRDGDTLLVHSRDRLARNLDDLRTLVQRLTKKGVRVEFLKEHLVFTGENSPLANLMLSVMGAFAEFERALIGERQREGITLARARGAYRGRRKALSPEQAGECPSRQGSCGGGPGRGSRRPAWPANSGSAAKPSTSTSGQRAKRPSLVLIMVSHGHRRRRSSTRAYPGGSTGGIFSSNNNLAV
jgi:predicted site-specific integrase-resolvase